VTKRPATPAPNVGHLRQAVDAVLRSLTDGADGVLTQDAAARNARLLRAGLAWTAATGDTCRMDGAVRAVRDALFHLTTPAPDGRSAAAALDRARDLLKIPARVKS
jgi:hypothetical protein